MTILRDGCGEHMDSMAVNDARTDGYVVKEMSRPPRTTASLAPATIRALSSAIETMLLSGRRNGPHLGGSASTHIQQS